MEVIVLKLGRIETRNEIFGRRTSGIVCTGNVIPENKDVRKRKWIEVSNQLSWSALDKKQLSCRCKPIREAEKPGQKQITE